MASPNKLPSSKNLDYSEIDDVLIVPPQPVTQKEYNKEHVPDISAVSDIVDNGSALLPTSNNFLPANISHIANKQQAHKPYVFNAGRDITERTNVILDSNVELPVIEYLNPGCQSCIINHAVLTNKRYNEQYILPKNRAPVLLPICNKQSDREMRFKSENGNLNKTCQKHIELNLTANSNHKSIACNHAQLSSPSNLNEPESFQTEDIFNCYCCKDQHSKLQKNLAKCERSISLDSRLGQLRNFEETCEKETIDGRKFKNLNIMCPACFRKPGARKPCTCNFSAKEYNANPHASSDALSSIREYLKQQDEKIDAIHEKVSNFLSKHSSCLIAPQRNEIPNAAESDIPYILNILEVHSDKIRELQDQINLLKSVDRLSSPNNNKIDKSRSDPVQSLNCINIETGKENINCPYSHNVVCHEQKQKITKTSTSTMTSLVIENNDKFVYHEQMTVVSDMKEKKEPSFIPNEEDFPTTKYLNEENVNSNSQKRKSHKLDNCSPSLKSKQNLSSNTSSDASDLHDNQVFKASRKSEKKSKRASTRNKVIDKKNVNDREVKENVEEKKNSPALKTAAVKSHSRSSKQKARNSTSPKIIDTETIRDFGNKKTTWKISESSSSTDTEYKSAKQRQKSLEKTELEGTELDSDESTTVSKYGLSSKNLSKATKRYLDTYGLRRTRRLSDENDA